MSAIPAATTGSTNPAPILEVEHLSKQFGGKKSRSWLHREEGAPPLVAVDDVSFTVRRGETLGIVGESGCGKSTLSRTVLRLLEPSAGSVRFDGIDVGGLDEDGMRRLRRRIQIVFQDPFGSLDPRMTALEVVREPLDVHQIGSSQERDQRAARMLELVGIAELLHNRRPYAFSGGQRQRIGIARAMVIEPELVFLDEPVSALDVSIQAQVLNLLTRLREELGLSYVFIVHDLAVAEYFCDRVIVLYRGAVMESAPSAALFKAPLHPYTASLLSAVPVPDPALARSRERFVLPGQVTPRAADATGCRFRERCPVGRDREICGSVDPPLLSNDAEHQVACHFPRGAPAVIARAADVCAGRLGVAAGEKVAVLHNGPQAAIAEAIAVAARKRDAEVRVLPFPAVARSGVEPPAEVADLLRWSDVGFGVTSVSLSHTRARIEACADGLRFASMPMLTTDIFLRTLPVDYRWMEAAGDVLAGLLTAADTCRITSAAGTDATISVAGRSGRNDDGDLTVPGAFGNLPAGEGYVAPVETAGEGTLIFDGALTGYGLLDEPLAVTMRDGSVVAATGKAASSFLSNLDGAEPAGSGRRIAELGIGTNPAATLIGVVLEDEKVLGTVHVAFGTSTGLGGINQSTIHIDGIMREPSLWIGETQVIDAGRFLIDPNGAAPAGEAPPPGGPVDAETAR